MQIQKPRSGYNLVKSTFRKYDEIPNNWEIIKIGSILKNIKSGVSRALSSQDIGYCVLTSDNIKEGQFDPTSKKYWYKIDTHGVNLIKYILEDGDVILNFINSMAQIGKSCIYRKQDREWVYTTNVFRIKTDVNKITNDFFYYMLNFQFLKKQILAITQPSINQASFSISSFERLLIYKPSIQEQEKIVCILSNIDSLIQKTQKIIEQTQKLKKSMMQKLFAEGIGHTKFKKVRMGFRYMVEQYPESWDIKKLSEVCRIERGKFTHRPRDDPDYYGGKHPFIQTGDVEKSNGYVLHYSQTLNEKGISVSKIFQAGIIVMTIAANIGSTAITTFPVYFPDSLVGISTTKMNLQFLEYYLQTRRMFLDISATVSAQKNINLETLKPLLIVIPNREEQDKIASVLSLIDSQIQRHKESKSNLENLKKGLMQKLLTGQIRVKV